MFLMFNILLQLLCLIETVTSFSCIDENKNNVDWWIALKAANSDSYYVYSDGKFVKSPYNVNQTQNGLIMNTVNQLYEPFDNNNVAYGMYNDEPPPNGLVSSTYGHSKGLLITNNTEASKSSGPSVFPDFTYGQSFICVSINASTADSIASNLIIDYPYIYDSNIGKNLNSTLIQFDNWLSHGKSSIPSSVYSFESKKGKEFKQFAKNRKFITDFWDDLVAPYYNTSINVETWRNGVGGRMSTICPSSATTKTTTITSPLSIYEVAVIVMPDGVSWSGTSDHSKWCNANNNNTNSINNDKSNNNNLTCVGDLNRMCSQEKRGGNAICLEDRSVWEAFNNITYKLESCWQYNPCTGKSSLCYWCVNNNNKNNSVSSRPIRSPSFVPSSYTKGYLYTEVYSDLYCFGELQSIYGDFVGNCISENSLYYNILLELGNCSVLKKTYFNNSICTFQVGDAIYFPINYYNSSTGNTLAPVKCKNGIKSSCGNNIPESKITTSFVGQNIYLNSDSNLSCAVNNLVIGFDYTTTTTTCVYGGSENKYKYIYQNTSDSSFVTYYYNSLNNCINDPNRSQESSKISQVENTCLN